MNAFSDLKIGTKIITGYVIALVLMVIVGGVALVRLGELDGIVSDLTNNLAIDRQLGNDIEAQILLARFYANKYTITHTQANLDRYREEAAKLDALLVEAETSITKPERAAMVSQMKTDWAAYEAAFASIVQIIINRDQLQTDIMDVQGPLGDTKIEALSDSLRQANDAQNIFNAGRADSAFSLMRLDAFKYLQEGDTQFVTHFDEHAREVQTFVANPLIFL